LAFRKVSERLGSTHWYLQTLRDSGLAAPRLSYLLATSRYVADGLEALPEAAAWLGEDEALQPRTPAARAGGSGAGRPAPRPGGGGARGTLPAAPRAAPRGHRGR